MTAFSCSMLGNDHFIEHRLGLTSRFFWTSLLLVGRFAKPAYKSRDTNSNHFNSGDPLDRHGGVAIDVAGEVFLVDHAVGGLRRHVVHHRRHCPPADDRCDIGEASGTVAQVGQASCREGAHLIGEFQ